MLFHVDKYVGEGWSMQQLTYHVAMSLDGFICGPKRSVAQFSSQGAHVDDYVNALQFYSVAIMGRHTYAVGLEHGVTNPYPHLKTYVVSRQMAESPDPHVGLISESLLARVDALKKEDGKGIYLVGGGDVAGQLLQDGLIDEVVVKLNPILLGTGISLFGDGALFHQMQLVTTTTYDNGVVLLRYRVQVDG